VKPNGAGRVLEIAAAIMAGRTVTTQDIRDTYFVSKATAKRDLIAIERHFLCAVDVEEKSNRKLARPRGRKQVFGVSMEAP